MEVTQILNDEYGILTDEQINEKVDRFCYDGFFHYLVIRHDELRLMLCQKMIPERRLVETSVKNGELYGRFYDHKKFVLDILAKDEEGYFYNLEMQCRAIGREDMIRFQCYGFRLAEEEARKGAGYDNVKPLRQMIINAGKSIPGLNDYIHHFVYYDEEHCVKLPHNICEIYIVQLEKLVMENMERIEDFDELMYLFQNERMYDKIEVDRKIREAVIMHDEYKMSEERLLAIQRERDERARKTIERVNMKKAEELGLEKGMKKGLKQGLKQGLVEGKATTVINQLNIKLKGLSKEVEMLILNSDAEIIDNLVNHIFDVETEEDVIRILK